MKGKFNVINQNRDYGVGKLEISVGQKDFLIDRESTKYIKKLKGEETLEAKTNTNFTCYDHVTQESEELNGDSRNKTDQNIRKMFGTVDDFLRLYVFSGRCLLYQRRLHQVERNLSKVS